MASRGGYDGGNATGGKIRMRPASRAAAASPYARPAAVTVPAAHGGEGSGGEGSGWLARLITGSASRLLSSVFRKPPPQLTAVPLPEPFDAPPTRPESLDAPPSPPELLDAPPSPPPPPPLDDDIPEGEENGRQTANNLCTDNPENSVKDRDAMLRISDCHRGMELEELLKQMMFTRTEFEYLAGLLRSRTVGYNTLQSEVSNIKQTQFHEKENGSRGLPVDFSIRSYSFADHVASPAELAKAYMGSRFPEGSPLRLRLHDPSFLPNKSVEAITVAKSPHPRLFRSARLSASTPFDRLGNNYMTPSKSAIHKMSSSPYFKGPVPSRDMSGTVSSSYQTSNSVHTFGRQILKRKSIAVNSETVSVGPVCKMRRRYNKVSPLLETRPGYRGYGSHARKLDEDSNRSTQIQKRQCLANVDDGTRGACGNSFGQAPSQSTEMAAKILKQLDTLAPSQKEGTSEIKLRHLNAIDFDDSSSRRKEISSQGSLFEPTLSLIQEYSLLNSVNAAAKLTPAVIDVKNVDDISDRSAVLESKSSSELETSPKDSLEVGNCSGSTAKLRQSNDKIEKSQRAIQEHTAKNSGTTNKEKPPTFSLQGYSPSNLVLSSEIDLSVMSTSSNGFSFPVTAALGAHSQAPPTPTMASPPTLPVGKHQSSSGPSVPVTSAESAPWISKRVSEEGSISNKHDKKLNGEIPPISSKSAGHVASFTSNPVFNIVNSKPTTLSNGLAHTTKSTASAVLPPNESNNSVFSPNAGSSTSSLPQFSFQSGFQTSFTSTPQSGGIQFKAAPETTLPFSMRSNSTGGSFTFSNTGPSSSSISSKIFAGSTSQSAGAPPSGSSNTPFSFFPKLGGASFLAAQDKYKAGSSSTPLNFSPQYGSVSSVASLDKSKVTSAESTMLSGNQCAQSGNSNLQSTQSSVNKSNLMSLEKSNMGSLPCFADSQFGSAPASSSPFSSLVSFRAASGSTSVNTIPLSLPATTALRSTKAFSASPIFGSSSITTAPSQFGIPNNGSDILPFSSTLSAVFSFTSATPTVPTPSPSTPNPSPSIPLFGSTSTTIGLSTGTDQMNGGHIAGESNQSPFFTTPPFGFQSNSLLTPVFSIPATHFASTSSTTTPGIFQFGQQSQASAGLFSIGTVRDNKSGRRILKVKRKK